MRYCGSKAKIAKYIIPFIMNELKDGYKYVEPFVGGCNLIDKVEWNRKVGYDLNNYVISLWSCLKLLGSSNIIDDLPKHLSAKDYRWHNSGERCISEYDYIAMKKLSDSGTRLSENDYMYPKWLIGYVGNACSYGSSWFNGLAKPSNSRNEDHIFEAYNGFCKQVYNFKNLFETEFSTGDYKLAFAFETNLGKDKNVVFYCDPPYKGTKGYKDKDFDHEEFWGVVRKYSKLGYKIFVSEYDAPKDFKCIWSMERKDGMGTTKFGDKQKVKTEKLFIYEKNY